MKAGIAAAAEEITAITAVSGVRNFNPGVVAVVVVKEETTVVATTAAVKEETTVVVAAIIKTVVVNLIITANGLIELYNQLVS